MVANCKRHASEAGPRNADRNTASRPHRQIDSRCPVASTPTHLAIAQIASIILHITKRTRRPATQKCSRSRKNLATLSRKGNDHCRDERPSQKYFVLVRPASLIHDELFCLLIETEPSFSPSPLASSFPMPSRRPFPTSSHHRVPLAPLPVYSGRKVHHS